MGDSDIGESQQTEMEAPASAQSEQLDARDRARALFLFLLRDCDHLANDVAGLARELVMQLHRLGFRREAIERLRESCEGIIAEISRGLVRTTDAPQLKPAELAELVETLGGPKQLDLFGDADEARSLLDTLLNESRLYRTSADYKALLDFVVRLRNFAPFNAMLLQLQKPGLTYAASASDWLRRFGRTPKEGARPLLILWPFGPVGLVYDVLDTEGRELPTDVASFVAAGSIKEPELAIFRDRCSRRSITWHDLDAGDASAGFIRREAPANPPTKKRSYRMFINRNHAPPVRFATLAHELAHLFLGHLGMDESLRVPSRLGLPHQQRELEAESAAFIVCSRNGVQSRSQTYLKRFVDENTTVKNIDIYQVMKAAGQIETLLGLGAQTHFSWHRRKGT